MSAPISSFHKKRVFESDQNFVVDLELNLEKQVDEAALKRLATHSLRSGRSLEWPQAQPKLSIEESAEEQESLSSSQQSSPSRDPYETIYETIDRWLVKENGKRNGSQLDPATSVTMAILGSSIDIERGRLPQALKILESVKHVDLPSDSHREWLLQRSYVRYLQGRYEEVVATIDAQELAREAYLSTPFLLVKAVTLQQQGEVKQAIETLRQLLSYRDLASLIELKLVPELLRLVRYLQTHYRDPSGELYRELIDSVVQFQEDKASLALGGQSELCLVAAIAQQQLRYYDPPVAALSSSFYNHPEATTEVQVHLQLLLAIQTQLERADASSLASDLSALKTTQGISNQLRAEIALAQVQLLSCQLEFDSVIASVEAVEGSGVCNTTLALLLLEKADAYRKKGERNQLLRTLRETVARTGELSYVSEQVKGKIALIRAQDYQALSRWEDLSALYREFRKERDLQQVDPTTQIDFLLTYFESWFQSGRELPYARVIEWAAPLLSLQGAEPNARARLALASVRAARCLGRFQQARSCAKLCLGDLRVTVQLRAELALELASIHESSQQDRQAIAQVEEYEKLDALSKQTQLQLACVKAIAQQKLQLSSLAMATLESVAHLATDDLLRSWWILTKAKLQLGGGGFKEAIALIDSAEGVQITLSMRVKLALIKAQAQRLSGSSELAIETLAEIGDLEGLESQTRGALAMETAQAYLAIGSKELAQEWLKQLPYQEQLDHPTRAKAALILAELYLHSEQFEEAGSVLLAVVRLSDLESTIHHKLSLKLAIAYLNLGDFARADDAIEKIDLGSPTLDLQFRIEVAQQRLNALSGLGHWSRVVGVAEQALALQGSDRQAAADLLFHKANGLRMLERWQDAVAIVDEAVGVRPISKDQLAQLALVKAQALFKLNRYKEVVATVKSVKRRDLQYITYAELALYQARSQRCLEAFEGAVATLSSLSLEQLPPELFARLLLEGCELKSRIGVKSEQIEQEFNEAFDLSEVSESTRIKMALFMAERYLNSGHYRKIVTLFRSIDPDAAFGSSSARLNLLWAAAYQAEGNLSQALQCVMSVIGIERVEKRLKCELYLKRAELQILLGRPIALCCSRLLDAFALVEDGEARARAQFAIAGCYKGHGLYQEALDLLERIEVSRLSDRLAAKRIRWQEQLRELCRREERATQQLALEEIELDCESLIACLALGYQSGISHRALISWVDFSKELGYYDPALMDELLLFQGQSLLKMAELEYSSQLLLREIEGETLAPEQRSQLKLFQGLVHLALGEVDKASARLEEIEVKSLFPTLQVERSLARAALELKLDRYAQSREILETLQSQELLPMASITMKELLTQLYWKEESYAALLQFVATVDLEELAPNQAAFFAFYYARASLRLGESHKACTFLNKVEWERVGDEQVVRQIKLICEQIDKSTLEPSQRAELGSTQAQLCLLLREYAEAVELFKGLELQGVAANVLSQIEEKAEVLLAQLESKAQVAELILVQSNLCSLQGQCCEAVELLSRLPIDQLGEATLLAKIEAYVSSIDRDRFGSHERVTLEIVQAKVSFAQGCCREAWDRLNRLLLSEIERPLRDRVVQVKELLQTKIESASYCSRSLQ